MHLKLSKQWIFFIISTIVVGATIAALVVISVKTGNNDTPSENTCNNNEYGTYPDCLPCLTTNCIDDLSCCQDGVYCSSQGECVNCLPNGDKGCPDRPCCEGLICNSDGGCVSKSPAGDDCNFDNECETGTRCLNNVCTSCYDIPSQGCTVDSECCPPFECHSSNQQCWIPLGKGPCESGQCANPAVCGDDSICCLPTSENCNDDGECCGEMTCNGGKCCLKEGVSCNDNNCCEPYQCLGSICQAPITYKQSIQFYDVNDSSRQLYVQNATSLQFGTPDPASDITSFQLWYKYNTDTTQIIAPNNNTQILIFTSFHGNYPFFIQNIGDYFRPTSYTITSWTIESPDLYLYNGGTVAFKEVSSGKYLVPPSQEDIFATLSDDAFYYKIIID